MERSMDSDETLPAGLNQGFHQAGSASGAGCPFIHFEIGVTHDQNTPNFRRS